MYTHLNHKSGMSLLELILALTMLSIILVGIGSVNIFVMRATSLTAEETRLQNQLEYVLKDIDQYLTSASELVLTGNCPIIGDCVEVKYPDDAVLNYRYDEATKTLTRTDEGTTKVISAGLLVPQLKTDTENYPIFEKDDSDPNSRLIRVRFSAESDRDNAGNENDKYFHKIRIDGTSRTFYLHGGLELNVPEEN